MSMDLAERARTRAGAAALCGWLLLEEPGAALTEHVAQVPALAALADPTLAVEFEAVFLRGVPPYESVFRSDDGQRGGPVAARVADAYAEMELREHLDGRWRVAGPDHLGLELRAHAHLIASEAVAWEAGRPDEAAQYVEAQRRFLSDHLATWAGVALDALTVAAGGTPYAALLEVIDELLTQEIDLLRPAPLLDDAAVEAASTPLRLGPARLARHLLAPERSGVWLSTDHIAQAARRLGFPWRPMDGRSNLRQLVTQALDAGELSELVTAWIPVAREAADRHRARTLSQSGAALLWHSWAARADATVRLLEDVGRDGLHRNDDSEIVIRVAGGDLRRALTWLQSEGYQVEELA